MNDITHWYKSRRYQWILLLTVLVVGIGLYIGLAGRTNSHFSDQKQNTVIRIGYLPIAAGLPLFVAVEEGYFKQAGIDIELIRFASSNDLGSAAAADRIDVMIPFALNAAFDLGVVTGHHDRLFGINNYTDRNPNIVDYFVAGPQSKISTLSDLKGKRIAGFPGSVTRIFVNTILAKEGLDSSQYTYLELAPKDWQAALKTGSIDAASVMEPQASQIIHDKDGVVIIEGFFAKLMPAVPLSGSWFAFNFLQSHPDTTAQSIVAVYDKAIDFIRANPQKAKQYYVKYIGARSELLVNMQLNDWRKSSELNTKDLQAFADLLYRHKGLQSSVDVKEYVYQTP